MTMIQITQKVNIGKRKDSQGLLKKVAEKEKQIMYQFFMQFFIYLKHQWG